jgi:signal transduction histidine kinase
MTRMSEGTPKPSERARAADVYAPAPELSHVWVRTLPAWHALCLGSIVISTVIAFGSGYMAPESRLPALALAGLMLVGYWAMFMRPGVRWGGWWSLGIPYVIALDVCFGILLHLSPYFAYLAFSVYPQIFFLMYARRRVVGVGGAGLVVALVLGELNLYGGWGPAFPHIASDLIQVAFAFAISLWVGSIAQQSLERQLLIDELERTRRELAAAEREAGVLEERSRLAREIHDTLAQGFASVVAHLEAARGSLDRAPTPSSGEAPSDRTLSPADRARVAEHLDEAEAVARRSLADARGLAWALRPDALASGGLPAAIERAVAAAFGSGDVAATMTITGQPRPLHPNVEVTLLRAAQEALANVRRHASAHEVDVTLSYFEDAVSLDVADDGVGFNPRHSTPGPSGGLGLIGIRERAELLGGSLAVESAKGRGTTIAVYVPTATSAEERPAAAVAR